MVCAMFRVRRKRREIERRTPSELRAGSASQRLSVLARIGAGAVAAHDTLNDLRAAEEQRVGRGQQAVPPRTEAVLYMNRKLRLERDFGCLAHVPARRITQRLWILLMQHAP